MIDDPVRLKALLRLYSGEPREAICQSLGITRATLDEWERNTPTSELLSPGLESVTVELRIEGPPPAGED